MREFNESREIDDYLEFIGENEKYNDSERRKLGREVKGGSKIAEEKLARSVLKFVIHVAYGFFDSKGNLDMIDLVGYGNVGVTNAVKKYNPDREDSGFMSYVKKSVRGSIIEGINANPFGLRVPKGAWRAREKFLERKEKLKEKNEMVSDLEVMESFESYDGRDEYRLSIVNGVGASSSISYVSLDSKDDDEKSIGEMLEDKRILEQGPNHEYLERLLGDRVLTEQERDVLKRRYGIGHDGEQTLNEVGKVYECSRERIRQIEEESLRKLRRLHQRLVASEERGIYEVAS